MENLIGDDVLARAGLLAEPDLVLHLYGKAEARPGRKMGHFTRSSAQHVPEPSSMAYAIAPRWLTRHELLVYEPRTNGAPLARL